MKRASVFSEENVLNTNWSVMWHSLSLSLSRSLYSQFRTLIWRPFSPFCAFTFQIQSKCDFLLLFLPSFGYDDDDDVKMVCFALPKWCLFQQWWKKFSVRCQASWSFSHCRKKTNQQVLLLCRQKFWWMNDQLIEDGFSSQLNRMDHHHHLLNLIVLEYLKRRGQKQSNCLNSRIPVRSIKK